MHNSNSSTKLKEIILHIQFVIFAKIFSFIDVEMTDSATAQERNPCVRVRSQIVL